MKVCVFGERSYSAASSEVLIYWCTTYLFQHLASADTRLLPDSDSSSINSISKSNHGHPSLTIAQLFNSPSLRPTTLLIAFVLASQQLAGINAVLFYSTPVLQSLLPGVAGLISIGISVVNALMTFPPLFLVDVSLGQVGKVLFATTIR